MPTTEMITNNLKFLDTSTPGLICYQIGNNANKDKWRSIVVVLNGNPKEKTIKLPAGKWTLAADGDIVNEKGIKTISAGSVTIPGMAAYVLYD
jgi:hypothetical protein